jgi:hypothetical protein
MLRWLYTHVGFAQQPSRYSRHIGVQLSTHNTRISRTLQLQARNRRHDSHNATGIKQSCNEHTNTARLPACVRCRSSDTPYSHQLCHARRASTLDPLHEGWWKDVSLSDNQGFTLLENIGDLGDSITCLGLSACSLVGKGVRCRSSPPLGTLWRFLGQPMHPPVYDALDPFHTTDRAMNASMLRVPIAMQHGSIATNWHARLQRRYLEVQELGRQPDSSSEVKWCAFAATGSRTMWWRTKSACATIECVYRRPLCTACGGS